MTDNGAGTFVKHGARRPGLGPPRPPPGRRVREQRRLPARPDGPREGQRGEPRAGGGGRGDVGGLGRERLFRERRRREREATGSHVRRRGSASSCRCVAFHRLLPARAGGRLRARRPRSGPGATAAAAVARDGARRPRASRGSCGASGSGGSRGTIGAWDSAPGRTRRRGVWCVTARSERSSPLQESWNSLGRVRALGDAGPPADFEKKIFVVNVARVVLKQSV